MFKLPCSIPLDNLVACEGIINEILQYKANNWAIGQLYPSGGADNFTYFFTARKIPIESYLRGTISIGYPTAYDKNIEMLKTYMNELIVSEIGKCEAIIHKIHYYQRKNFAIGEAYPDGGPDEFVYFFGNRNLKVVPYLRGTVDIGTSAAYEENIQILKQYMQTIKNYKQ